MKRLPRAGARRRVLLFVALAAVVLLTAVRWDKAGTRAAAAFRWRRR